MEAMIQNGIRAVTAICVVTAVAECAVDGRDHADGLRLVCGTALTALLLRAFVAAAQNIL